jgi:hypothetical protein
MKDDNGDGQGDVVKCSNGGAVFQGRCVATCPAGYFKTTDPKLNRNVCSTCDTTCKSCVDVGVNNCNACWGTFTNPARYLYLQTGSKTGPCVTKCPDNQGMRLYAGVCDPQGCRTSANLAQFQRGDQTCWGCNQNCRLCSPDPANNM